VSRQKADKVSAAPSHITACTTQKAARVLGFYSDKAGKPFREFSNFFSDAPPFRFDMPAFAFCEGLPQSIDCEFAEKAIMLAKAAMMGDKEMFHEIAEAKLPKDCKKLGRGVHSFDAVLWDKHLEELVFEVVKQKFVGSKQLRAVLMATGDQILAEAAPNDCIWGIGLKLDDDRVLNPAQWCGRNILGYALMKVRSFLRGDTDCTSLVSAQIAGGESSDQNVTYASDPQEPGHAEMQLRSVVPEVHEVDPHENFLRSVDDMDAVRACYDLYGVVGVTGVLSACECDSVIAGLEFHLPEGCLMHDADTFSLADHAINRYGVIGKEALFSPALLSARLHPNVSAAYAAVHGREDVFACHDRAAWMRPVQLNPAWDTPFSWPGLHLDISLSSYFEGSREPVDDYLSSIAYDNGNFASENNAKHRSMGRSVQGVLNLYDNDEEDGGFHCVPGLFGDALHQWVREHPKLPKAEPNGKYELKGYGVDAKLGALAVRVPCPAGTLILFDATLPHGTRPNASAKSRAILFLRYITSDELPTAAWQDRNAALRRIVEDVGFEPTSQESKHLYGPE